MERERLLVDTFVQLADSLVNDFEIIDLLSTLCRRCHDVLDVDAVGVLLAGEAGYLELSAASTERTEELELFQMQSREGPCVDAFRTGEHIVEPDMARATDRWPEFAPRALALGYGSVFSVPLRLRGERLGALNMFRHASGALPDRDRRAAQALADVATIAILQERAIRDAETVSAQLQHALDSRVLIEQAKGVTANQLGIGMGEAFERLRREARGSGRTLRDVCRDITEGVLRLKADDDDRWDGGPPAGGGTSGVGRQR